MNRVEAEERDRAEDGPTERETGGGAGVERVVPSAEFKRRRRARSIALAIILAALVALFYVVTLVRLGGNVLDRPL